MTISILDGLRDATDCKAGEGYVLRLQHDQPEWGRPYAAEAGILILPLYEGNLTTGDPVGDAYAAADLADRLDLDRKPTPPLVLRLDPAAARESSVTAGRYAKTWADAAASRGYRPIICSSPDVIFSIARESANFEGAFAEAFSLLDGPDVAGAPDDPRQVPGLPGDVYGDIRAYRYADGLSIADEGFLARVSPRSEAAAAAPTGPPPVTFTPPTPGPTAEEHAELVGRHEDLAATVDATAAVANDNAAKLAEALAQIAALQDLVAELSAPAAAVDQADDDSAGAHQADDEATAGDAGELVDAR